MLPIWTLSSANAKATAKLAISKAVINFPYNSKCYIQGTIYFWFSKCDFSTFLGCLIKEYEICIYIIFMILQLCSKNFLIINSKIKMTKISPVSL